MNDKGYMLLESIFYMAVFSIIAAFCMDIHINCAMFQRNVDSKLEIIQQGIMIEELVKKRIEGARSVSFSGDEVNIEDEFGKKSVISFDEHEGKLFYSGDEYYRGYEFGDYVEDIEVRISGNNIVDVKIDFKKGKLKHRIDFRVKNRNAE